MPNVTQVNAEWARMKATTIEEHLREVQVNIVKNNKILAMLDSRGRISYGHSGIEMTWRVRKKRSNLVPYDDGDNINIPRVNKHDIARLPWRGYTMGEAVTLKEKKMNRGKEAIIRVAEDKINELVEDAKENFGAELFIDGEAAGNLSRFHGLQSCMGVTGSNQFTAPSDTYGGLSTVLGNYGGAVLTGSWPSGTFDPEYYFWSPTIVNYTHASWSPTTDTWANTALEALRSGIAFHKNAKGKQGALDMVLVTVSMYVDALNLMDDKERILVERNGQASELVKLGFKDVFNYDGVDVTSDYDCPDTQGWGLAMDSIELCMMGDQMFEPHDDMYLPTLSDQYVIVCFGNMRLNPRRILFFDNIT